ncbi:MAG: VanZ family protein [Candidatus Nanohaloarchaea archaeon]
MRKKLNFLALISIISVIFFKSLSKVPNGSPSTGLIPLHAVAYFVLAGGFLNLDHRNRKHLESVSAAFLIGLLVELIQLFLPYRFFGWNDILMNLLGASIVFSDIPLKISSYIIHIEDFVLNAFVEKTGL